MSAMDMHLEVDVVPVSDVDRAKSFYERLGWRFDADESPLKDLPHRSVHAPGLGVLDLVRQGNRRGRLLGLLWGR